MKVDNTSFFQKAKYGEAKVVWKELLSESFQKHSSTERAYALSVGTPLNQPTEANMLRKWHKPWLWYPAAKFGLGLFLATLLLSVLMPSLGFNIAGIDLYYLIVLPQIVPLIVMVFLWELNVPQNISIWELIGFYLVGGLLSFVFLNPMYLLVPAELPAVYASLQEEPPKLAAAVVLLLYLDKKEKKRIYGVTGLVVGAAVGAGFAALESVQYAIGSGGESVLLRAIVGVGGHMVYAAPYVAAYAHGLRKTGSYLQAFATGDFLLAFGGSILLHSLWNSGFNNSYITMAAFVMLKWVVLFYWVRKYLVAMVDEAQNHHFAYTTRLQETGRRHIPQMTVTCVRGNARGRSWNFTNGSLVLGRDTGCDIVVTGKASGVSRQHCVIRATGQGFTIRDLNSSYGTYLTCGRLPAGVECALGDGEYIFLGSKSEEYYVNIH